MPSSKNTHL